MAVIEDDQGKQVVALKLTCGPNKAEARLPMDAMVAIIEKARTFEDIRREFFTQANLSEMQRGRLRVWNGFPPSPPSVR